MLDAKFEAIESSLGPILEKLESGREDLTHTKSFVTFALDSLETIFAKYNLLAEFREDVPRIGTALERVESSLDGLASGLRRHNLLLLQNDLSDLDVELKLLQQTVASDGL